MLTENPERRNNNSMFGFGHNLVNPIISSLVYSILVVALGDMNKREKLEFYQTVSILQKKISGMSKFMKMGKKKIVSFAKKRNVIFDIKNI